MMEQTTKEINSNLYFIHIPKCAGTYIRFYYEEHILISPKKHIAKKHKFSISNKQQEFLESRKITSWRHDYPEHVKTFAIIRNPFDLMVSWFYSNVYKIRRIFKIKSFEEYINFIASQRKKITFPQRQFLIFLYSQLFDENNNCKADYIIRYENLYQGLKIIFEKENINAEIIDDKTLNKSFHRKRKKYKQCYTKEMQNIIEQLFGHELEMFGYSFDKDQYDDIFVVPNFNYNPITDKIVR